MVRRGGQGRDHRALEGSQAPQEQVVQMQEMAQGQAMGRWGPHPAGSPELEGTQEYLVRVAPMLIRMRWRSRAQTGRASQIQAEPVAAAVAERNLGKSGDRSDILCLSHINLS